jgi:site-specific DNA-methyltransferase (adenine-specific)
MPEGQPYMPQAKRQDWETPWWLFDLLDDEFDFTVDAAANDQNAKMDRYWTEEIDGLAQDWIGETLFINPPFRARDLKKWTERAWHASRDALTRVVMVVPVKADQSWWHEFAIKTEIRFIKGRIKFVGAKNTITGPVAVLVFGRNIRPIMKTIRIPGRKYRDGD